MKRRAFPGHGPEIDARYQRAGQWILATLYGNEKAAEWCKSNGVAIVKAAGEGIGTSGGVLVPAELAKAILDLRDSYGAFRRRALVVPMATDTTRVVRRQGGANAFFMAENSTVTHSTTTQDAISLTAKKIGVIVKISSELEEDAAIDIVDFVANEIAYAFAAQEDDCAFNGDGTSTYGRMRGISSIVLDGSHATSKVTAAAGHNTFLTLDVIDLANLMNGVQASAIPNAAWFCSETCFAQTICRISGGNGPQSFMKMVDGIMTPHYLGFPIVFTQKLPQISTTLTGKVMLAFGDMYQGGVLGQRRGLTLARSADRYMDQDQIAVLGTERFHAVVHGLGDNTTFSALAALVAP